MKRLILPVFILFTAFLAAGPSLIAGDDPHAYFNALVERPDHWKSYSLRPQAGAPTSSPHYTKQLDYPKNGGYRHGNSGEPGVTYSPATDTHPLRQDAAKVVIPASMLRPETLASEMAASTTGAREVIRLSTASGSAHQNGTDLKIGNEWVTIVRGKFPPYNELGQIVDNQILVERGQFGTQATAHSIGTPIRMSTNSLDGTQQIRLPLQLTTDGNTYLITWDTYWTDSYVGTLLTNHKWMQITASSAGGSYDSRWLELQSRFDGGAGSGASCFDRNRHVAALEVRGYLALGGGADWSSTNGYTYGPNVGSKEPLGPMVGEFCIHPNRWTRVWVRITQRANDYDLVDLWVADEEQGPVQILRGLQASVPQSGSPANSLHKLWLEYNTSTTKLSRYDERDLVSYVRNVVVLINPPSDVTPLLLRPSNDGTLPPLPVGPFPPRNVRILGSE
jgi:hypothetical protein